MSAVPASPTLSHRNLRHHRGLRRRPAGAWHGPAGGRRDGSGVVMVSGNPAPTEGFAVRCGRRVGLVGCAGPTAPRERGFDLGELSTGVLLVAVAWCAGRLKRTRRAHLVSLRERAEYLERQRESELRMASINERTRIARDLHDVISHSLSAVTLLADGAVASLDTNPADARDAMVRVRYTSREAMKQMRSMLSVLRTDDDQDLTPAPRLDDVSSLLAEARAAGTPVHTSLAEVNAPADVQVVAYRVIQEALTNVRKHAKTAQRVEVEIARINHELRIRITDDGQDSTQPEQGHGLTGMTERVTALGGILHASHCPTGGFEVLAQLPLRRENP